MKSAAAHLAPAACFLFAGLSPAAAEHAVRQLPAPVSFEKGRRVSLGQDERALGIVLQGSVCVRRAGADGREQRCNRLLVNEAFGAATLFGATLPVSRVLAEKDCLVQFVPEETLLSLIRTEPAVAENYARFLTDRLRFLNRSLNGLRGGTAAQKLLVFLRSRADGNGVIVLPSMAAAAATLNIGRTSLYRALDELEQTGALTRNGKTVTLSHSF